MSTNGKFPAEDTLEDPCEGTVCTAIFPAIVTTGGSGVNPESSRAEQFATLLGETTGGAKFAFCEGGPKLLMVLPRMTPPGSEAEFAALLKGMTGGAKFAFC